MQKLKDKIAVITGGTRGFGLAVAVAYAQEGAAVVVASRSQDTVDSALEILRSAGAKASGVVCDVGDRTQVGALGDHAIQAFGGFDIWVNNAAASAPYGPVIHNSPASIERVIQTNILGAYYGSMVAMRYFLTHNKGKLINVLGAGDRGSHAMQAAYGASKAWLINFTTTMAKEYKDSGVGVYAFNPGMMDTDLLQKLQVIEGYESRLDSMETVMRILSKPPEEPARRAVWLASTETDGRTGLVIRETSPIKMLIGALQELGNNILRRPKRSIKIEITTIPPDFKPNPDEFEL